MFPDSGHDSAHISIVLTQVKKQTHLSRRYLWSRLPRDSMLAVRKC